MRRQVAVTTALLLALSVADATAAGTPRAGATCSKQGITQTAKGMKYRCIRSGGKLVWGKGVRITVTKPSPTPTPSPTLPALPQSSDAQCDFTMAPLALQADFMVKYGTAPLQEGKFPKDAYHPSIGSYRAIFIYVNYRNLPGKLDNIQVIKNALTSRLQLLQESSYGQFAVALDTLNRVITLPRTPEEYGTIAIGQPDAVKRSQDLLFNDVVQAADPYVDFSKYTSVWIGSATDTITVIWGNHGFTRVPGFGVVADGNELRRFVTFDAFWEYPKEGMAAVHEFSHTLGLPDIYYGEAGGEPGIMKDGLYPIGRWDPMAGDSMRGPGDVHFLGWHKYLLGWLQPQQVTCLFQPISLEETLSPIETSGGKKLFLVPVSASRTYVFEVRRKIGEDAAICREGVLVYRVDSQVSNSNGPIQAISPASKFCLPNGTPFMLGEKYEDANISFEVIGDDGTNFRIKVTRTAEYSA